MSKAGIEEVVVANVDAVVHREHPGQFALTLKSGWRALPVPGSTSLFKENAKRFVSAFRSFRALAVYAVALEMRGDIDTLLRFPSTIAGLKAFDRACAHFNYALTTYDCAGLLVCTTDDYMVICGPEPFFHLALGQEPKAALEEFHQYATESDWGPTTRRVFESVWSAFVNPGPVIVFPGWVAKGTS